MHEEDPCLQPLPHTPSVDCLQYQQLEAEKAWHKAVHLLNEAINVISVWLVLFRLATTLWWMQVRRRRDVLPPVCLLPSTALATPSL